MKLTTDEQAGITDHQWTVEELYDIVTEYKEYQELQERTAVLARKLGLS